MYPLIQGMMFILILSIILLGVSSAERFYIKKIFTDTVNEVIEKKVKKVKENDGSFKFVYIKKDDDGIEEIFDIENSVEIDNNDNEEIKKDMIKEIKKEFVEKIKEASQRQLVFAMMKKLANEELYEREIRTNEGELDTEVGMGLKIKTTEIKYTVTESGEREIISGDLPVTGNIQLDTSLKIIGVCSLKYAYPMFLPLFQYDYFEKNGEKVKRIIVDSEFILSI